MAIAWLLTHDNQIDRRIDLFEDGLRRLGWSVTTYAGLGDGPMLATDPPHVRRPYAQSLVQQTFLRRPSDTDLSTLVDASAIAAFHDYDRSDVKPKQLNDLLEPGEPLPGGLYDLQPMVPRRYGKTLATVETLTHGGRFARVRNQSGEIVWSAVISRGSTAAKNRDSATLDALRTHLANRITKALGIEGSDYPAPRSGIRLGEQGRITWADDWVTGEVYLYDRDSLAIRESKPILPASLGPEELNGKTFDFADFRRNVYEFSPIWERIKRDLSEGLPPPSLIYVADLPTLPMGIMLKRVFGAKLIIDCHEWWYEQAVLWAAGNKSLIRESDRYEKELYPECDLRITVGMGLAEAMAEYLGCSFSTIYSATPAPTANLDPQFRLSRWKLPNDAQVVIFQGSMTEFRNLDTMARATKYLKENQYLVVVGDGPYRPTFEAILRKEGDPSRVVFAGWVAQAELLQHTLAADLALVPYRPENRYYSFSTPNKLFEFLAARIPIVCDRGMSEVARVVGQFGVGDAIDCSDAATLGQTLSKHLNDPGRRAQWQANYRSANNRFHYEAQVDLFMDLVAKLD